MYADVRFDDREHGYIFTQHQSNSETMYTLMKKKLTQEQKLKAMVIAKKFSNTQHFPKQKITKGTDSPASPKERK